MRYKKYGYNRKIVEEMYAFTYPVAFNAMDDFQDK